MFRHLKFVFLFVLLLLAIFTRVSLQEILIIALVLYGFDYFFSTRSKNNQQPAQPETMEEIRKSLLGTGTAYYAQLNEPQRLVFEERVQNFIGQKQFIARGEGMVITTEMKVQIAACAVQLTFGLPELHFTHFRTILIYPDRYYSTIYKRYHCGEVNAKGLIVLSWRDFETGNRNEQDGLNLGLHEMAHALHLENSIHNEEYDFLNQEYLTCWVRLSEAERSRMQVEKSVFRRLCAAPDTHEFFAVAVELFFEMPLLLEKEHPEIYKSLSNLLNQHPARQAV
jgi:Mlc titration factor MtfA (ptsG expression regulator)